MAQFGTNTYGMSYYGITGIRGAQALSDEIVITRNYDDELDIYALVNMPKVTYSYDDVTILYDDPLNWTDQTTYIETTETDYQIQINLTASSMTLHFLTGAQTIEYTIDGGAAVEVDTSAVTDADIDLGTYQRHIILITAKALTSGLLKFAGYTAFVTDMSIEFRAEHSSVWTGYEVLTMTRTDSTYNSPDWNDLYEFNGTTTEFYNALASADKIQFRILLATSDTDTALDVIDYQMFLAAGSEDTLAESGLWKATIDVDDIDTLDKIDISTGPPNILSNNGYFKMDSNSDGLADGWAKGANTTATLTDEGYQSLVYTSSLDTSILKSSETFGVTNTEYYYIYAKVIAVEQVELQFYRDGSAVYCGQVLSDATGSATEVQFLSALTAATETDVGYVMNILAKTAAGTCLVKEMGLVEVTYMYETGNEPAKADLDAAFGVDLDVNMLQVRARSASSYAVDGTLWGGWSSPVYQGMTTAAIDETEFTGYIMSPVLSVTDLTNWLNTNISAFSTITDPYNGISRPGQKLYIELVTTSYNPNAPLSADVLYHWTYYEADADDIYDTISNITYPVRLKITMTRTPNTSSPEILYIGLDGTCTYSGLTKLGYDIIAHVSQAYGEAVYTWGTSEQITILSLNTEEFMIDDPGSKNLTYTITPLFPFTEDYPIDKVRLYWLESGTENTTSLTDELYVELNTQVHTIFGAGIVNLIAPDYLETNIPNMFNPALDPNLYYIFKIYNGWIQPTGTIGANANVDMTWAIEIDELEADRTYWSETYSDDIAIRVKTVSDTANISWVSAEYIYSATVNSNGVDSDYQFIIEDPPQLEPGIIFGSNPYTVEIIAGTVVNNGHRVPDDRISITLSIPAADDIYPGIEEQATFKVAMTRGTGSFDYLPNTTVKSIQGIYNAKDATVPYWTEGTEYVYAIDPGQTYSNMIEWGTGAPALDTVYYVDYTYDAISTLKIDAECTHTATETIKHIYRSAVEKYSGVCSVNTTYISDTLNLADFTIADNVEPSTIRFVLYDNNPRVNTFINSGNRVEANLGNYNPRLNWHPYINDGYYFINDNKYYIYNNVDTHTLDNTVMTMSSNITYVDDGSSGLAIAMEPGTTNLLSNSSLSLSATLTSILVDSFIR